MGVEPTTYCFPPARFAQLQGNRSTAELQGHDHFAQAKWSDGRTKFCRIFNAKRWRIFVRRTKCGTKAQLSVRRGLKGYEALFPLDCFVHKHLNFGRKKSRKRKHRGKDMGKFAEADAELSNISVCRKCKARNKRNAAKCRKCGSIWMRPKRKDIRVKK